MSKRTPGPWRTNKDGTAVLSEKDGRVCVVERLQEPELNIPQHVHDARQKANARLLAAAPDLLAACSAALSLLDGNDTTQGRRIDKIIRAAIRKATGQRG